MFAHLARRVARRARRGNGVKEFRCFRHWGVLAVRTVQVREALWSRPGLIS